MMYTYVLDNYLKQNPTSFNSIFNEKIKDFLDNKKVELSLKGVFYTYYSKTNDYSHHLKMGFFSEKEIIDVDKLKSEIKSLINKELEKQGDMIKGDLYLPCKADALTGLIACYSFELLKLLKAKMMKRLVVFIIL